MRNIALVFTLIGILHGCSSPDRFRAGEDSLKFNVAISADERQSGAQRLLIVRLGSGQAYDYAISWKEGKRELEKAAKSCITTESRNRRSTL